MTEQRFQKLTRSQKERVLDEFRAIVTAGELRPADTNKNDPPR